MTEQHWLGNEPADDEQDEQPPIEPLPLWAIRQEKPEK